MMNKFIFTILILINFGCSGQNDQKTPVKPDKRTVKTARLKGGDFIKSLQDLKLESDSSKSYVEIKKDIKHLKLSLNSNKVSSDSLSIVFKRSLVNQIFPFWEGTEWSFEGHTSIPRKGKVACGYFLSTTLRDMGLNVNRYKLAQQSPMNEGASLAINSKVTIITENSSQESILKISQKLQEGIHFIGFDSSHVGYILKEKEQLYLIHSNYENSRGVEIEKIETSNVFTSYDKFYITEISTNEALLKKWVNGDEIEIVN